MARSRFGGGVVLVTSLMVLALAGCEPTAPSASEPTSNDDSVQSEKPRSGSGLLLSEDSAISILQTYLQDCVLRWDTVYKALLADREDSIAVWGEGSPLIPPAVAPIPSDRVKMRLMDLAIRTNGEIRMGQLNTMALPNYPIVLTLTVKAPRLGLLLGQDLKGREVTWRLFQVDGKYTRDTERPFTWTHLLASPYRSTTFTVLAANTQRYAQGVGYDDDAEVSH